MRILIVLIAFACAGCTLDGLAHKSVYPFEQVNEASPSTKALANYPNTSGPVIFYLHGNGENIAGLERSGFVQVLSRFGYVVVPEYPGLGPVSGEPSQATILDKVRKDYTNVRKDWYGTGRKIVIVGRSLGAAVAAQLSKLEPSDGLVLISPWTKFKDAARASRLGFLTWLISDGFFRENEWNSLIAVSGYPNRALVMHGRSDSLIPVEQGRAVSDALKIQLTEIDSDHNDIYAKEKTWVTLSEFLSSF